ncbi:MAG: hypothetical protein O2890_15540 [Cyanobacteria bacterium]|nr:hypothetical protein [Cyanobacteriota bacterium]MDA0867780.1 hypothetical protein [Cyanobacteriota bacterium]
MARKSKSFGKLLRQAQQENTGQGYLKDLEKKVASGPLGQQLSQIIPNPKGEVKMSAVLEDFVEPYLDGNESDQAFEAFLNIAVIAWNIALFPEDQQPQKVDLIVAKAAKGNTQIQQEMRSVLEELITRKQQHFASIKRQIVEFQLKGRGKNMHLSVAATLSPK